MKETELYRLATPALKDALVAAGRLCSLGVVGAEVAVKIQEELKKRTLFTKETLFKLREIANRIDELAERGEPYGLTFYFDKEEPLTSEQKKRLTEFLAHQFHKVWANTWLHIESDRIRGTLGDEKEWCKKEGE